MDKKTNKKLKEYDKAYDLKSDFAKRAVAVDYVIDTNRRGKDGSTGKEPKMNEWGNYQNKNQVQKYQKVKNRNI